MAAKEFLERVGDAMSLREAGKYINAPRVQMHLLHEHGIVQPFVSGRRFKIKDHAFAKRDLNAFLSRLYATADAGCDADPGLVDIPDAVRIARCSAADIVTLLLENRLSKVARRTGDCGYMSMLVSSAEVRSLVHGKADGALLSLRDSNGACPGRRRWSKGWPTEVHLRSAKLVNPITLLCHRMTAVADLEAFGDQYVSLHGLET